MKRTALTLMFLTAGLLPAYGAESPASPESPASEEAQLSTENAATQVQALYDSCTDSGVSLAQPDGAAVNLQYPNCSYADSAAASIDASYDQSLCPNKFVTEVRQVNSRFVQPFVEAIPASEITTESVCEGVAITGYAWGLGASGWTSMGSVSTTGVWHPGSCGPLFCVPASCQLRFNVGSGGAGYSKVRVAGFAAALGIFKGRVRTGVRSGGGPC